MTPVRSLGAQGWQAITLLGLLALPIGGFAQTPQERAQVETFLRDWKKTNLIVDSEFDKLKPLGKHALPLLADYLSDKDLGFLAESAMQRLDPNGAMPYLLKNLPNKDPNVQRDTFRLANRRMMEYDWYVRSGKPPVDPNKPAPRYPSNIEPYPYRQAIHDAAVQLLQAKMPNGSETQALTTLGLTGSARDLPLLRRYAAKEGGAVWEGSFHIVSIAAMARLGDKQALDAIAAELEKPVLPHPAQPYVLEGPVANKPVEPKPGAVVASTEDGQRFRSAAFQAGFSMNRRFVPLLIRHMDDPPGQFHGDYADPSPAREAMAALAQIVYGKEYGEQVQRSPEAWKQWGREHAKEFGK